MSMLLPGDRMGITCKTIWDEIKKDATRISYALHPDIIRIK